VPVSCGIGAPFDGAPTIVSGTPTSPRVQVHRRYSDFHADERGMTRDSFTTNSGRILDTAF